MKRERFSTLADLCGLTVESRRGEAGNHGDDFGTAAPLIQISVRMPLTLSMLQQVRNPFL
jgi:hypothetical protein